MKKERAYENEKYGKKKKKKKKGNIRLVKQNERGLTNKQEGFWEKESTTYIAKNTQDINNKTTMNFSNKSFVTYNTFAINNKHNISECLQVKRQQS